MVKNIFMEAAQQKAPKKSQETLENTVLFKLFSPTEIKKMLADKVSKPTVDQVANLASGITIGEVDEAVEHYPLLHKEQILRFFKNEAKVDPEAKIDSTAITRPHLISLVETLEGYTGLKITDDSQAPLRYLDERSQTLTIEDLSEFFAHCPSRIITILSSLRKGKSQTPPQEKSYDRDLVKNYLKGCCGGEVDESKPVTSLHPNVESGSLPYLTVVFWLETKFNRCLDNRFLERATIGELINAIAK